jgi:hypothetical protein
MIRRRGCTSGGAVASPKTAKPRFARGRLTCSPSPRFSVESACQIRTTLARACRESRIVLSAWIVSVSREPVAKTVLAPSGGLTTRRSSRRRGSIGATTCRGTRRSSARLMLASFGIELTSKCRMLRRKGSLPTPIPGSIEPRNSVR